MKTLRIGSTVAALIAAMGLVGSTASAGVSGTARAMSPNEITVARDDRFLLIGKSIPTELTVTIQREGSSGFVASSGNVDKLPLPELPNNVTPLSWRECSTGVPCRE